MSELSTGGAGGHGPLQHHFRDLAQQKAAASLGMWVFIAQEVLFFGGLFTTYAVYRHSYPEAFAAGSHHLSWQVGFFNTLVLIGSSLTMAMGVYSAVLGPRAGPPTKPSRRPRVAGVTVEVLPPSGACPRRPPDGSAVARGMEGHPARTQ